MEKKEQKLVYTKSKNFNTNSATGVYGGITGIGQISINFYIDSLNIPETAKIEIDSNGVANDVPYFEETIVGVRELICGIVMDINMAKSFHAWLGSKIDEYEKMTAK